jgi:hypothetical protein
LSSAGNPALLKSSARPRYIFRPLDVDHKMNDVAKSRFWAIGFRINLTNLAAVTKAFLSA